MNLNALIARMMPMSTQTPAARRSHAPFEAPSLEESIYDGLFLRIPASAATLEGFCDWATSADFPQCLRATYINQEIILDMSPEEIEAHGQVKAEIGRVLCNLNRDYKWGRFLPDGTLIANKKAGLANEPDGMFVLTETLRTKRIRLLPYKKQPGKFKQLLGTPDWVMEIVSDSSVAKDTKWLRKAYHRAGVREFWLIDARGDTIDFQILVWRKNGYVALPASKGWHRSPVFGRSFRLDRERDELGLWDYTLHVRPE
jgi:Uma2 family endonuclease